MSDNRKYYYLKLKENFFDSEQMIVLESLPDGHLYSNILLKLYLRSLKNEGKLMFNDRIPYNSTILAQVVRQPVGVVEKAVAIYKEFGLIEIMDNGAIYMLDIQNYIGQSSTEADRQRDYQHRINMEKGSLLTEGTECKKSNKKSCKKSNMESNRKSTPEIELDIDKDIYTFSSDSNEYRLAEYLYRYMLKNNPKCKEPNFHNWSKQFDYILRIDKRDIEEVKAVIKFSQTDNFWSTNILSPSKLREKYDQLLLKMKQTQPVKSKQEQQIQPKCKTVD